MISQHAEWLNLVEVSGPFLAVPVLEKIFPQGLEAIDTSKRKYAREVYEYRCDAIDENHPQAIELNRGWIRIVLKEILDFDDSVLISIKDSESSEFVYKSPDGNGAFVPDFALKSDNNDKPFLLVSFQPPDTDLEKVKPGDNWPVSIVERMTLLCRSTGVRLGLVTNGERWMLVNAPADSTSGHTSWYSRIWFQEPVTFQAFKSLFEIRRWFGPNDETLSAMLEESLEHHEEVTDTLGEQVKRAVEVLVQSLDKADQDRNGNLLKDVNGSELYEAGLTVMMRLVFVLCAEERGLFLLGDPTYDRYYAISTMRSQLAEEAGQYGPEVLGLRHDAWSRLLSVFRAVYGGVEHETLRMAALGGSLFDPDRYPFLEGRDGGTCWADTPAQPLPIDNRTVLLLLNALQVLEQRGGALLLSYKALDVEQIGHVYEGLLEHTVQRLQSDTLGLVGSKKAKNPNVSLAELESACLDGIDEAAKLIKDISLRGLPAIKKALEKDVDEETYRKVLSVCGGDKELSNRIRPFSNLLRTDAWGDFIVYRADSFAVTLGADRRETGTHYTPKSLTESIVETTLEPVVYVGPSEGTPRDEWQLKSSTELLELKICDPAMGSGAFLVQVCRWLSERLVEAWGKEAGQGKFVTVDGVAMESAGSAESMPDSLDERLLIARRLVAEKCLYGVDLNPLAVELAKLSIWLTTLAKGRPFGFLDHNLRSGDSLLGLHKIEQLTKFSLHPEKKQTISIFASNIEGTVKDVLTLRKRLRETPIRDIRDVQYMEQLDQQARQKLKHIDHVADAMIGESLASGGNERALETAMENLSTWAASFIKGDNQTGRKIIAEAGKSLSIDLPVDKPPRKPFHWALEFPEVFERGGFDGIVGNPPYMGGQKISGNFGYRYRNYLINFISGRKKGSADLCAYFLLRSNKLLNLNGLNGFILSSSICEGDTREIGLQNIVDQGDIIIKALSKAEWPGKASVTYSPVWIAHGKWSGEILLNNKLVKKINAFLSESSENELIPKKLRKNNQLSFQGMIPLGKGFVISKNEALSLIDINKKNKDVIFPYLIAKELNIHPAHEPSSWIINFKDWPLKRDSHLFKWINSNTKQKREWLQEGIVPIDYPGQVASDYPECLAIVEERVKPERQKQKNNADGRRRKKYWWRYGRYTPALISAISELSWVLAIATQATKYVAFGKVTKDIVFSNSIAIIASDDFALASVISSSVHEVWARKFGGHNLLLLRYSPSDLFETFPIPTLNSEIRVLGKKYYDYRSEIMIKQGDGLTKIYNKLNDPNDQNHEIQALRSFRMEMDKVVASAYGWIDLDLRHGFYETQEGIRFTISEQARSEVLQRLLKLNHERYKEEVAQGLHDKKKTKKTSITRKKKASPAKDNGNLNLFNFMNASPKGSK